MVIEDCPPYVPVVVTSAVDNKIVPWTMAHADNRQYSPCSLADCRQYAVLTALIGGTGRWTVVKSSAAVRLTAIPMVDTSHLVIDEPDRQKEDVLSVVTPAQITSSTAAGRVATY
jgi:hypothetical protein